MEEFIVSKYNKTLALILCIFLGYLGVHHFYVNNPKKGLLYLCTIGLCGFGWIIDIILLCIGKFKDGDGLIISSNQSTITYNDETTLPISNQDIISKSIPMQAGVNLKKESPQSYASTTTQNITFKSTALQTNIYTEKELQQNSKKAFATAEELRIDDLIMDKLRHRYIAFDVETTGLSPYNDRIVEIGAVIFENQIPINEFGTLVNPGIRISARVTAINHITNDMIESAPNETQVYKELISFLGDALDNYTIICAHNAKFDMGFLTETLMRLGYDANISYVDTLSISKKTVYGLENYKQPTLAKHFEINNEQEHRAASDAKVCGIILSKLLYIKREEQEKIQKQNEKFQQLRKEYSEKRKTVIINPTHNRVPISNIRNLNDFDKGFDDGYKYWYEGDILRKGGDLEAAIQLFDKARYNGYNAPVLYDSYAKAYRQIKDYDNEIDILDEAIERNGSNGNCEGLEERRYKAICLLIKKQQKQQENIIKEQIKLHKNLELKESKNSSAHTESSKPRGRAVLKLSDDMNIIKKYDSIADASRDTDISPKCIRDAAKGIQNHAGNFVWRYEDEFFTENVE